MHKLLAIALLILIAPCSYAARTAAATTTGAVVRLVVGTASAKASTTLASGSTFSTGKKSRSELALANGLVRTGSDTQLGVVGPDAVELRKGLALIASNPKFFRGSVQVSAPGYAMKVRGTAQVYYRRPRRRRRARPRHRPG